MPRDRWHVGCRQCTTVEPEPDGVHRHGDCARESYELRYQPNRRGELTLDEVVARDATVHLEQMDDDSWWLGVDLLDGQRLMISLARRKRKVHATVEVEPPSERPEWQRHELDARIAELREELWRLTRERAEEIARRAAARLADAEREQLARQRRP